MKCGSYLVIASLLAVTPAFAVDTSNGIVGTWTLKEAVQTESGQPYMGTQPLGQLIFESDGRFSNILLRSDLPKFKQNNRNEGSPEENAAVVKGSIAYYGTYVLDGDRLKMHIDASTFPNWTGTDQARTVHQNGNQLVWENAAASGGGGKLRQVYDRVK
jgi:lipocalin-like protein